MNRFRREDDIRILAVDPTSWGFGFAVLEGATFLVDWGTKYAGRADSVLPLTILADLLDHYVPDRIVLEDVAASSSRRRPRVRALIVSIEQIVTERGMALSRISRAQVQEAFGGPGVATKQTIAADIADHFRELVPRLPPRRKAWMSEDERMSIFDAVAFALAFYFHEPTPSHATQHQDQPPPETSPAGPRN